MINWLHSRLYRPENGWDPISKTHADQYAEGEWSVQIHSELINTLELWCNGLAGKTVLDYGGGPGQYSMAFARLGAEVTWFDISKNYRTLAQLKAKEEGLHMAFAIGYLDEACDVLGRQFDLVFNRICWNYGRGDRSLAKVIYNLAKPGGVVYIDAPHDAYMFDSISTRAQLRVKLNKYTAWKIGHPYPPRGRLAKIFGQFPTDKFFVDYSAPMNDRILFRKPV